MVLFKNKYSELRSGWVLLLSILIGLVVNVVIGLGVGIVIGVLYASRLTEMDAAAMTQKAMEMAGSIVVSGINYTLMIGLLFLLFRLVYKRPLRQMGLFRDGWASQLLYGGLFGIVSIVLAEVILLVTGSARIENMNWGGLTSGAFWSGFALFVFVGFYEEILSRGVMMTALKTTRVKWLIVLLPSALFGFLHILNDHVTVFSLANIALVGVVFSCLFVRTGRLWAPIGFHITWNFVQGNVLGVPVSGLDTFSLMDTVFTGPEWLTGGAFGIEGGAACTIVTVLGLLWVRFGMKQQSDYWRLDGDMPLTRGMGYLEPATEETTEKDNMETETNE